MKESRYPSRHAASWRRVRKMESEVTPRGPSARRGCTKLRSVLVVLAVMATGFLVSSARAGELHVTSTAYNSLADQTDSDPNIAAWGDSLEPGMKVIAVSRDLLELGLKRGSVVYVEGFPGEFVVLDKMARRWEKRIDIYMGEDVDAARRYGKRSVRIRWKEPDVAAAAPTNASAAATVDPSGSETDISGE